MNKMKFYTTISRRPCTACPSDLEADKMLDTSNGTGRSNQTYWILKQDLFFLMYS